MEAQILAIGLPTLAVLIGILLNNRQNDQTNQRVSELRADTNRQFDQVQRQFEQVQRQIEHVQRQLDVIAQDLRAFYSVNAEHSVKIQNLERKAT